MKKFMCGADPEVFLQDAAGAFISAVGKIGGSKAYPRPLFDLGEGFAVQEDNVAVEYNIPASGSKEDFIKNINTVTSYLQQQVNKLGLRFSMASAVSFPETELQTPEAQEFGCDPDFDAWRGRVNPRPRAVDHTLRSCGGHVHVGFDFGGDKNIKQFIKYMDLFLAVPSAIMDDGVRRKELYGKRGAYRVKPFGCEYRVLSNFWTFSSERIGWVWDSTELAMDAWQNKTINVDELDDAILSAVNNNDKKVAEKLIKTYNLLVV